VAVGDRTLPCGRDPVVVWDDAGADRLDAHELACRCCQAVVAECGDLAGPTGSLRQEPLEVPAYLWARVMSAVRDSVRPVSYLVLGSGGGPQRLEKGSVAAALRWAVDQLEGVRARSVNVEPLVAAKDPIEAHAPQAGLVRVRVALSIVCEEGSALLPLAEQVRVSVRRVCATLLGLDATRVDVQVADLYRPIS